MSAWLLLALAWLAGVAWQTQEAGLWPVWAYGATLLASGVLACAAWALSGATCEWRGQLSAPMGRRAALGLAGAMLAMASLAWASTGWRAVVRMSEQVPLEWLGQDVPVLVQVEGLPRATSGGDAVFDARVLAWWPDAPAKPPTARCDQAGCPPTLLSVRMPLQAGVLPRAGQRWRLHVRLHEPDGPSNPGGHDPTLAYFERGVRAVARVLARAVAPVKLREGPTWPWQGWIDRQRQDTRDRIFAVVPDKRAAGVLAGLAVGDQSAIERADWDVFRNAGLGHVVSISGTHIAMLGWLAAWLTRRLWSRWQGGVHRLAATDVALWAGVVFSVFYALLAGWGVPAQRTVWMMFIVALMRASGRRWPWPLVWLSSAVILTALDPWCVRQPGFWLSYVAVGVLMSAGLSAEGLPRARRPDAPVGEQSWGTRMADGFRRVGRSTRDAAIEMTSTQWLVTTALLPLILACFGQVSMIGLGANLFAIPFFTLGITPLALLGIAFEPCWTFGVWLIQLVMGVLADMSALPFSTRDMPDMPFWMALPAVLAGWSLALRMAWAWRLAMLPFALVLLYLPQPLRMLPAPAVGHFQLLAVDIGQGTAVLVRTSHHTLLFDTGPRQGADSNAGERILVPLMRALGVLSLDTLIISHEDTDHVGGAEAVVSQLPVSQLLSSLDERHPLRNMKGIDGHPLPHEACVAGQSWHWDGVRFELLNPTGEDHARRVAEPKRVKPNDVSCVLRVSARAGASGHAASALITGDIGEAQEAAILSRVHQALQSTVLIAPHHGSDTSSSEGFLRAVNPRQVLIQVGRRNAYGHPAPEVIARYRAMKLPWLSTPDCGAYVWYSDERPPSGGNQGPQQPVIGECWRQAHRHYWQGLDPGG